MNEFGLISKYFAPLAQNFEGALGLKDDAAIISPKSGYDLVITKDAIVENVHFLKSDSAFDIAIKLMGVNLSDIAAMGATPLAYLIALTLPDNTADAWFAEFANGIKSMIDEFGGALIGGDTTSHNGPLTLSLTAIGQVPSGKALKRSGAMVGDIIFVSGTIGDSYLGLQILQGTLQSESQHLTERYRRPNPCIRLGAKLHGIATACIDISDGLVADLGHICSNSNVGATINIDSIPVSDDAKAIIAAHPDMINNMITGGDDYELLFTCPAPYEKAVSTLAKKLGLPLTKIGVVTSGNNVKVTNNNDTEIVINNGGYQHF
jgi:thiamine-monophosphate kinase